MPWPFIRRRLGQTALRTWWSISMAISIEKKGHFYVNMLNFDMLKFSPHAWPEYPGQICGNPQALEKLAPCQQPSLTSTAAAWVVPRVASRTMASASSTFEPNAHTSVRMSIASDATRAREGRPRHSHARRCKTVSTEKAWERGRQSMKAVGHGVGRRFFKGIGANDIV